MHVRVDVFSDENSDKRGHNSLINDDERRLEHYHSVILTILGPLRSWSEILWTIAWFFVLCVIWRFVTSGGPGPSLRAVCEQNRTLESTEGRVKGATPGY
jgi:hypothetical protein